MINEFRLKLYEAFNSVIPITAIVFILSTVAAPIQAGYMLLFILSAVFLIFGMAFFTFGADISMIPMGEEFGHSISKSKNLIFTVLVYFILGTLITVAEPDLQVLANQLPGIPNMILVLTVACGVGTFMAIFSIKSKLKLSFRAILIILYAVVFILAIFTPNTFIPVSFDSGGVTTGPITVPFIMALCLGIASLSKGNDSKNESFGLVALCSIGPIMSVLILGMLYRPSEISYSTPIISQIQTTSDVISELFSAIPAYCREILVSILPITIAFLIFELFTKSFSRKQIKRIIIGLAYTYIGLVMFLSGVNIGFMPVGNLLGNEIAQGSYRFILIPIGMLIGYFIVSAEPAVHVLTKQVYEITNGSISQKTMGLALSIGVAVSVGISMLRILTGISIIWFLIPGYALSLLMTFFVPEIFTVIAFDSGGVASGPMTATFLLPFAMGACSASGGNVLTDAFGLVAMVAMTPLITIQSLGLIDVLKKRFRSKNASDK